MPMKYSFEEHKILWVQGRCKCGRFIAYWTHYCERCRLVNLKINLRKGFLKYQRENKEVTNEYQSKWRSKKLKK